MWLEETQLAVPIMTAADGSARTGIALFLAMTLLLFVVFLVVLLVVLARRRARRKISGEGTVVRREPPNAWQEAGRRAQPFERPEDDSAQD